MISGKISRYLGFKDTSKHPKGFELIIFKTSLSVSMSLYIRSSGKLSHITASSNFSSCISFDKLILCDSTRLKSRINYTHSIKTGQPLLYYFLNNA